MDTSKTLTGGDLWNVLRTAGDRRTRAEALFGHVRSGVPNVRIARTLPLAQGAHTHAILEGRQSSGKVVLTA